MRRTRCFLFFLFGQLSHYKLLIVHSSCMTTANIGRLITHNVHSLVEAPACLLAYNEDTDDYTSFYRTRSTVTVGVEPKKIKESIETAKRIINVPIRLYIYITRIQTNNSPCHGNKIYIYIPGDFSPTFVRIQLEFFQNFFFTECTDVTRTLC